MTTNVNVAVNNNFDAISKVVLELNPEFLKQHSILLKKIITNRFRVITPFGFGKRCQILLAYRYLNLRIKRKKYFGAFVVSGMDCPINIENSSEVFNIYCGQFLLEVNKADISQLPEYIEYGKFKFHKMDEKENIVGYIIGHDYTTTTRTEEV